MEHSTEQDEAQIAVEIPRPDQDEIEKSFRGDRIDFLAVSSQGFDGAHTIELDHGEFKIMRRLESDTTLDSVFATGSI